MHWHHPTAFRCRCCSAPSHTLRSLTCQGCDVLLHEPLHKDLGVAQSEPGVLQEVAHVHAADVQLALQAAILQGVTAWDLPLESTTSLETDGMRGVSQDRQGKTDWMKRYSREKSPGTCHSRAPRAWRQSA